MQAIITKYLGPTNRKGARISATWQRFDGPVRTIVSYDHNLNQRSNHALAAMKLVRLYTSEGNNWHCGEMPNHTGYAFVMLGEEFSRHFGEGND